jgi:hypothetical protein
VSERREVYEKLLEYLHKELEENQRDLRKAADHYDELIVERRELMAGIFGIEEELRSGLNDD